MPSKNKLLKAQEKEKLKEEEDNKKILDDYWSQGTNKKADKKAQLENEKQMEKMQKAKEKQELLKADEESTSNIKVTAKKGKKSKTDDFAMLNQSLASAPKTKKQKEQEEKIKEQLERKKIEEKIKHQKEEEELKKEEERKLASLKNINIDHQDELMNKVENKLNYEIEISGIDDAINVLDNKKSTCTFNEFHKNKLENLKNLFPGLRLSQYNEKIQQLWKKSPENPKNLSN
tara:strand:- start:18244 stop:18939 length:696 start_codon:yes stop_codon:yes gene_type:complete